MGLSVSVGVLAWCIREGYAEEAEGYREDFRGINHVLAAHGLPPHIEPEELPPFEDLARFVGMPYSWLHYLRRAIAYARQAPDEFRPVAEGEDPSQDPRVDHELSVSLDSHLICHSDCEGYYIPIDFPEPLYDDYDSVAGGILGSSHQAMRELIQVAPLLGIRLRDGQLDDRATDEINEEDYDRPYAIERKVWLLLFERLRISIEYRTAVVFG
jgi:hypothetical protein